MSRSPYFFWIVVVSSIYLFIFFDTSVVGAYESVERLTHRQWYAGGVMRSLHRYASDALVVAFGCDHGADVARLAGPGVGAFSLPCTGALPPSFIEYALTRGGVDGVLLTGCRDGDCYHRLGVRWTEQRLAGERDPYLRERVPRERVAIVWAAPGEFKRLAAGLSAFRARLGSGVEIDERRAGTHG